VAHQAQQEITDEQIAADLFRPYSTLDEPVRETILRDLRAVGAKLQVIMRPLDKAPLLSNYAAIATDELTENDRMVVQQLKDWDLWGPLVLCLALGIILSWRAGEDQSGLTFAAVFWTVWIGGTIVTLNVQLLGGTISFFQSLCVLGYSIFPLVAAAILILILPFALIDFAIVAVGFLWSTRISSFFISLYISPERKLLALYPVFFFYLFLSWMVLLF